MRTRQRRLVTMVTVIGVSLGALSQAGPGDVVVTSIVSDYDSGIAPALQIQSDQLGAYTDSKTLTSVIQSVGAWLLNLSLKGGTRTVYLGFNQPVTGSGPGGGAPTPPPSGTYAARIISKCNNYGNSMLTMAPGATMPCPLHVSLDSGGNAYDIFMNPDAVVVPAQQTNYANITCIYPSSGNGPCSQWKIAPSATFLAPDGSTAYQNVGALFKSVTSKGQTTYIKQGDFYFSFLMIVTK